MDTQEALQGLKQYRLTIYAFVLVAWIVTVAAGLAVFGKLDSPFVQVVMYACGVLGLGIAGKGAEAVAQRWKADAA